MQEEILTVNDLLNTFQKLSDAGKGNMKIKCQDNYLHTDEISYNYATNEILLRGCLCNFSINDKINQFCEDIEKAQRKFYGNVEEDEETEKDN